VIELALAAVALVALAAIAYGAGTRRYVPPWPRAVRRRVLVAGRRGTRPGAAVLLAVAAASGFAGSWLAAVLLAGPGVAIAVLLEVRPLALERRTRGATVRGLLVAAGVVGAGLVMAAGAVALAH
jgi:hypothetical protein